MVMISSKTDLKTKTFSNANPDKREMMFRIATDVYRDSKQSRIQRKKYIQHKCKQISNLKNKNVN